MDRKLKHEYVLFNHLDEIKETLNALDASLNQGLASVRTFNKSLRAKSRGFSQVRDTAKSLIPDIHTLHSYFYQEERFASTKRGRGRPAMVKKVQEEPQQVAKRGRGRPRKEAITELKRDLTSIRTELKSLRK